MNRDAALLLDILIAARDARAFSQGLDWTSFSGSRLHQNAIIRCLEIIGEAAGKASFALRAANEDIPWREITGMRHRLIHGYSEVQLDIVWDVVQNKLPPLIDTLMRITPPEIGL